MKEQKLEKAHTLSDVIDVYPVSWIAGYISAGISIITGDQVVQAMGINDTLTTAQKELLKSAELGDEIIIDVAYTSKNFITQGVDMHTLHYTATLVPEHEAEFPGGLELMTAYLKENAMRKIPDSTFKEFQQVIIRFTIDEHGEIAKARFAATSGDPKTDELLLNAINRMPKWRPAVNADGVKVKQEFEFSVGGGGC